MSEGNLVYSEADAVQTAFSDSDAGQGAAPSPEPALLDQDDGQDALAVAALALTLLDGEQSTRMEQALASVVGCVYDGFADANAPGEAVLFQTAILPQASTLAAAGVLGLALADASPPATLLAEDGSSDSAAGQTRLEDAAYPAAGQAGVLPGGSLCAARFDETADWQSMADPLAATSRDSVSDAESANAALAQGDLTSLEACLLYGDDASSLFTGGDVDQGALFDASACYTSKMELLLADDDSGNASSLSQLAAVIVAAGFNPLALYVLSGLGEGLAPVSVTI